MQDLFSQLSLSQFGLGQFGLSQFHFLRPYWLLTLLPAIGLGVLLWRQKRRSSQWESIIPAELLRYLLENRLGKASHWPFAGLIASWMIASVALAGPTWQRLPQPVHQSEAAVVVLFDMSPSMVAEDIKPSRLQRASFKLHDYLNARVEGLTALIAYAGEAHVVSPLTDDTATIANLLPALHPAIMPLPGSNAEMAVDKALTLFKAADTMQGEILLVTDGVTNDAFPALRNRLAGSNFRLSILGVGTAEGAPIPTGDGGFARGGHNDLVIAKLNRRELQTLSNDLGGTYADLSADDRDIQHLLTHTAHQEHLQQQRVVERDFDTWHDQGQWLALLLLPFAALAFRRGWLLSLLLLGLATPLDSHAFEWRDLWQRPDQQGAVALEQNDPATAATKFKSHDWRGTANYRSENYSAAAEAFAQGNTPTDHYNRGNALAKAGKLEAALEAYEQALEQQPDMTDAESNADLIRQLLEQQQQQQQADQNSQDQPGQDSQQQNSQQSQQSQQEQQAAQQQSQQQSGGQQDSSAQQNRDSGSKQPGQQNKQQSQNTEQANSQKSNGTVDEQAARELADRQADDAQQPAGQAEPRQATEAQTANSDQEDATQENGDHQAQQFTESDNRENTEQQQALEQWLRQIPDDPGGLLRRKFEYEHRKMRQQYRTGDWLPPENEAYQRW
jgi:Ca-activated chloride channel homolog